MHHRLSLTRRVEWKASTPFERIDLIPELETITAGSHLCHLYASRGERQKTALSFLYRGLERGEKTVYVGDRKSRAAITEGLAEMGVDVPSCLASGQLMTLPAEETYLPEGTFDPAVTLGFWTRLEEMARGEGWAGLRAAGEMSWVLTRPPGWEKFVEYEAEVNRLPAAENCVLLCQYDRAAFDPRFLLDLLRVHPLVAVDGEVFDNPYYLPPGEFLHNMSTSSVLHYHLEQMKERKIALSEVLAAREFAEAIVETVREPLLVLDADLRVVSANRSFYRTFQVGAEETVGRLVYELGDREWDIPELRGLLEDILPLNTSFEGLEVEREFPRIGRKSMVLNARRIHHGGHRAGMILLALEDATARRKAEERMRGLSRLYLSLGADFLSNMESVIVTCRGLLAAEFAVYARPEGGKLSLLTTLPGEEGFFICERPSDFAGWPLLAGNGGGFLAAAPGEGERNLGGDPLAARHGCRFFLGVPVLLDGHPKGVLGVYAGERGAAGEDERETLALLARALQIEEERLARERGLKDFIDVASHELRHPVTIIKGYALTLKERMGELAGERVREMLTAIDQGSDRITRLVESLLDTSNIERGRFQLEPEETDLSSLLRQAVEETGAPEGRILLTLRGELGSCRLDRDRLLEVLSILLDNANKFSPPGTAVEVEAERMEGACLVSVLDRGPGIPPEERERVFDRFHQLEQVRFHSKPGMGMGLFIAREIVERHGGKIWCEKRAGGGSAFRFTLPL
ncbi:MAG: MEDS domain-containing protein [Actinomycetota bacterium]|nr:MEDS domain-containing protein [Actinomycetota bacterium]